MDIKGTKGLTRTDSGLIVPESSVEKKRQAWPWDSWKRVRQAIKTCMELDIVMRLYCGKCGKVLHPKPAQAGGGFTAECECTVRTVITGR